MKNIYFFWQELGCACDSRDHGSVLSRNPSADAQASRAPLACCQGLEYVPENGLRRQDLDYVEKYTATTALAGGVDRTAVEGKSVPEVHTHAG